MHLVRQWRQQAETKRRVARDLRSEATDLASLLDEVRSSSGPHVWVGRAAERFADQLRDARADVRAQQDHCRSSADLLDQQARALDRWADDRERWLAEEAARRAAEAAG
jgi:uncharacterized protein YukE